MPPPDVYPTMEQVGSEWKCGMQSRDVYPGKLLYDRFLDVGCKEKLMRLSFLHTERLRRQLSMAPGCKRMLTWGGQKVEMAPNRATGTQQ